MVAALLTPAFAANPQPVPTLRWVEGAPNCSVRAGDEGRIYYTLSGEHFEITLAVDRQELQKVPRRTVPMIGAFLSLHYTGNDKLLVLQNHATLEFVKHFHVIQRSLDPDTMIKQLQQNMDDLSDEVEHRELRKHPEQKEKKEAELQQRLKDYTEMMDFISTQALRGSTLDASNSTAEGWVFFSTKNRWIGPWRRPEQFIFRMPIENVVVEFPFELPSKYGSVDLRRRSAD
jgi:hypothetical protein